MLNANFSISVSTYVSKPHPVKGHVPVIQESYQDSYYSGTSGIVQETGGRQMYLELEVGDTVHLHCNDCFIVSIIHFCVKLDYPIM